MIDIVVRRRRRHPQNRARTGPMRLNIVSFRFAAEGPLRRMTTVLVQGRMDQCAAMKQAAAEAGTRGPEPWLTDINTVPPLRHPGTGRDLSPAHGIPDFPRPADTACRVSTLDPAGPDGPGRCGARPGVRPDTSEVGRPTAGVRQWQRASGRQISRRGGPCYRMTTSQHLPVCSAPSLKGWSCSRCGRITRSCWRRAAKGFTRPLSRKWTTIPFGRESCCGTSALRASRDNGSGDWPTTVAAGWCWTGSFSTDRYHSRLPDLSSGVITLIAIHL